MQNESSISTYCLAVISRINPIKKLDVRHQAGIIAEICELTLQPSDELIQAIKQEPYSKAGGMFNILAHRFALRR